MNTRLEDIYIYTNIKIGVFTTHKLSNGIDLKVYNTSLKVNCVMNEISYIV